MSARQMMMGRQPAAGGGAEELPVAAALHVAADTLSLSDGNSVATWADGSGNGNDLTSAGAEQPVYKTSIINGLPVVRFATNSIERIPASFAPGQPLTVMCVFKPTDLSGFRVLFDSQATNPCDVYFSAGGASVTQEAGSAQTSAVTLATGTVYTLIAVFNGASSKTYINGGAAILSGNVGSNGLNGVRLGKARNGGSPLNGDIGEFAVFGSALSLSDINLVGDYTERWGHTWSTAT